ncbi:Uma2 family endonuclease [Dyadobacter sp. OTU695]|uniref:Uma2 family endonuclease n=1 Tax=Dyadobacter sp. OTU695 TaxID=3043860 RepID=UPI00313B1C5B
MYRKGYKEVLKHRKSSEIIEMGCSFLQALIATILGAHVKEMVKGQPYWVVSNEAGLHISRGNNLANDIAVFDKALVNNIFSKKIADVPPKVAIEVDVKIEADHFPDENEYMFRKSEKMIEFGTERVIWVLTDDRKIMAIDRSKKWAVYGWEEAVPVFDDYQFCLNDLLKKEGVI